MMLMRATNRHPELVLGSMPRLTNMVGVEEWVLKQVQQDERGGN